MINSPEETFDELWKEVYEKGTLPVPPVKSWLTGLKKATSPEPMKSFLEVGSGSGILSAELAKLGVDCTLVDASFYAIKLSQKLFCSSHLKGEFIVTDLFSLPFKDSTFDVVWNSGVLEHFPPYKTNEALKEMARVTKKTGSIVVLVPSSLAVFYRIGKYLLERSNKWLYGYERPIKTFKGSEPFGWKVVDEFQVGVFTQGAFLPFPMNYIITNLFKILCLNNDINKFWQKIIGGYLLVSKLKYFG